MNNLDFTPDEIPSEIQKYDSEIKQLEVGKSGKVGILEIELKQGKDKTSITKQFSQVPLQIQRAVYLEESLPEMAYVYIISPSGGILQGDRYKIDITLKNNAISHITTQGATRIYSMNSNFASQITNITVDDNCYLEYIPDQIIPYQNSRYYQKVNLNVHDNATVVYSEILTPGRMAMNELFDYEICYLRMICKNQENKFRCLENMKIEPKNQNLKVNGIFGKYSIVGTVYVLTKKEYVTELENIINIDLEELDDISIGTSVLPNDSGIIVKILGRNTEKVIEIIYKILKITRKKILGAEFSKIRKN
ncbi:MAG: urease accessory protein UreD [Nitrosopumilus sp.]|nr:urease accessory protein UreD [Nitrosopumilus sp.]MBT3574025.1 urease accessory protein UreD [Nitrosopumilus sp.]MBT3861583.1 urease accessory protein UreD [Nitrosopumilus sp.]MBT3955917.1 urease accessory protein UreD [Nitrosopumilus sp.]MBT4298473.1 urease accessory protein UreD [Nitrosopumilus sp.]